MEIKDYSTGANVFGLTSNTTPNKHCLMIDIDSKKTTNIDKITNLYLNEFATSYIVLETNKGFHFIGFCSVEFNHILKFYALLLKENLIDLNYVIFSLEDGFSTLRISKKSFAEKHDIKFYHFSYRYPTHALTHLKIYKELFDTDNTIPDSILAWKNIPYPYIIKFYHIPESWK